MPLTYRNPRYPFRPLRPGQRGAHHPVIVVGGGVVGLTVALDLARRGIAVLLLDEDDTVSFGSRAICWSKRSLEIYDRLGLGQRLVEKGVTWNHGKVFHRERLLYGFDLLPEEGHARPAFVNLQQYYLEDWLVAALEDAPLAELRWQSRVAAVAPGDAGVDVSVATPEGGYELTCDWLIACDGARSPIREALGLPFEGKVFHDHFLIADVLMEADYPAERWFWFDPPFHRGQSVLLHKQADRVWRIDFQLGPDADPEAERDPARVTGRLAAMLGPDRPFQLEWVSAYSFKCRRLERFRHGRLLFAGDAAHQVSPFGARGGNGGVQDADNLGWKLAAVLRGEAPERLLDSYDAERVPAAEENLLHSTRATDFITPKSAVSRAFRDAVLELAAESGFARRLLNSGRLSRPHDCLASPLSTADDADWAGAGVAPGCCAPDAPLLDGQGAGWLLGHLGGGFVALHFAADAVPPVVGQGPSVAVLTVLPAGSPPRPGALVDSAGLLAARLGGRAGTTYLLRPDQVVAARWRRFDPAALCTARDRALGRLDAGPPGL